MAQRCASHVCLCARCWTKVHVEIVIGAISRINEDILRPTKGGEKKEILVSIRFGVSKKKSIIDNNFVMIQGMVQV